MSYIRFIRTTHHNGHHRSFPTEAMQFWREHGTAVGEVLRLETPLTFAEIVTASREVALEYPESGLFLTLDEEYVAWCLIRLLEYGMAGVVAEPVSPAKPV